MVAVNLKIAEPLHHRKFIADETVRLVGEIVESPAELNGVTLYYRWYSSLFLSQYDKNLFSINGSKNIEITDPKMPYDIELEIGSHVITLAATDVQSEALSEQSSIKHGGVTGGSKEGSPEACIIHVFKAEIIEPLNRGAISPQYPICVRGPITWWKKKNPLPNPPDEPFEINADYHVVNRIQYRFVFDPVGPPEDRPQLELIPDKAELRLDQSEEEIQMDQLLYHLPPDADLTGTYTLTLYVQDIDDENIDDQVSILVTVGGRP